MSKSFGGMLHRQSADVYKHTHRVDCLVTILNSVICHLCVKMQSSRDMWWTGHIHSIMVEMPPLKNLLVFAVICLFVSSLLQTINDMWRRNIKPTHSSSRIRKSQYKSIDCSRPYNRIYDLSRAMSTVAVLLLLWVFSTLVSFERWELWSWEKLSKLPQKVDTSGLMLQYGQVYDGTIEQKHLIRIFCGFLFFASCQFARLTFSPHSSFHSWDCRFSP